MGVATKIRSFFDGWLSPVGVGWGRRAGYGFALALSLLTFAIRVSLEPVLEVYSAYLLFTLPVAISAMWAGSGPALLSAGLGVLLSDYFIFPRGIFAVYPQHLRVGIFETAIFLAASALLAKLGGEVRTRRLRAEATAQQLRETLAERDAALERVSVLSGLLPVCAACKSIRDEDGKWVSMEAYLSGHSAAKFTHGMCPKCMEQWYGDELRRQKGLTSP
jgi:K+-sensing histidine kinase KdpD